MATQLTAGTNYYRGDALKIADSKTFFASLWFKQDTAALQALLNFHNAGSSVTSGISILANGGVTVTGRNAAETLILASTTPASGLTAAAWHNVIVAVDLADAEPVKIYINGTKATETNTTATDDTIEFSTDHLTVGASRNSADAAVNGFTGALDEIYFTTTYINPDTAAELARFIGLLDEQIGLGHQARNPLDGTRPDVFLTHGPGNFGRNEGTADDLATVGAPTFTFGRPAAIETLSRGFWGEEWRESERSGIPFRESRLVLEPSSGLEVARREFSTDRDEINRRRRFGHTVFEF